LCHLEYGSIIRPIRYPRKKFPTQVGCFACALQRALTLAIIRLMKNFEERLERLEGLSDRIRDGEVSLEEAAQMFEEGIKLARGLEKDLSRIERKIEVLVNQPSEEGEKPVLELFPELDDENR